MSDFNDKTPIGEIADKGAALYERIKNQYEPQNNGSILAIEPYSEKVFLGNDTLEAVTKARQEFPDEKKKFFIVKVGFSSVETMARMLFPQMKYDSRIPA